MRVVVPMWEGVQLSSWASSGAEEMEGEETDR